MAKAKVSPINSNFAIEWWDIDRPTDYPLNARKWKPEAVTKVAMSLKTYGWRQPIVVDKAEVIVIGHLRRAAARQAGMTQVPVHIAADLSPEAIRGLRLADNRTHDEAEWDTDLLAREFGELKALDFDLGATAFQLADFTPGALSLPEAPASVAANAEALEEFKRRRKSQNAELVSKNDSERYLVIVYPSRGEREAAVQALGLPAEERYISANAVQLRTIGISQIHGAAAPKGKAGTTG